MTERKKKFFFQLRLLVICLLAIEIGFRLAGYKPGNIKPNWYGFNKVDSLCLIPKYFMNQDGILVADSNYWNERKFPINPEGFLSRSFTELNPAKKKVMLIGDSFTWGMSAMPLTDSSFASIMQAETNYEVINLGIPGTDPVQYSALAQKYIPQLKPDYVFVFVFMGNDLMQEDRDIDPHKPLFYYTNAGTIAATIDGIYFNNAYSAYSYVVNEKYYLGSPKTFYEKIIACSSLLSRLYSLKYRVAEKIKFENTVRDCSITKKHLKKIKETAAVNGVPVNFVVIPELKEADMPLEKYKLKYANLLSDTSVNTDWFILPNSKANFTKYPDGHLNNKGHRLYANYLVGFLKNTAKLK